MEYWNSYDKKLINKKLQSFKEKNFLVWQLLESSKAEFKVKLKNVNDEKISFDILESKDGHFEFVTEFPIILQLEDSSFVFKKEHFTIKGKTLELLSPLEAKIKEKRSVDRLSYRYQDHKSALLYHESDSKKENAIDGALVDISIGGLGLIISVQNVSGWNIGDTVVITNISDQKLQEPHQASISHFSPVEVDAERKTKYYRLGLKFEQSLDSVNYQSIRAIITKKQKKSDGLNVTTFCGLDPEEQERKLAIIAHEKPAVAVELRENIEYLENLSFLTKQMKQQLLLDVNIPIFATALRLSSKELIYDLLIEVSDNLREEILYYLNENRTATMIREAQTKICGLIRDKEKKGELILDARSYETIIE